MFEVEEGTETEVAPPNGGAPSPLHKEQPVTVPYATFKAKSDVAKAASDKAKQLEVENATLKAAADEAPTLRARIAALTDELDLSRAGLNDPEAVEIARIYHGKLPEKDRPSLGEYYKSLAADPTKAPKAMQGFFPSAVVDPAADAPKKPADPPPNEGGSNGKPPPTGDPISAATIKAARERWQASGSDADRAELERLTNLYVMPKRR